MVAWTVKAVRRNRNICPGGKDFESFIRAFLPVVYGTARLLVPNEAAARERVVVSVFKAFAFRWKRLPRKTVVATWLLRSTWLAAKREWKALGLAAPAKKSEFSENHFFFRRVLRLQLPALNALVLRCVFQQPIGLVAKALRTKESRVEKRVSRAPKKLQKIMAKRGLPDPTSMLQSICSPAPPEIEAAVLGQLSGWSKKEKKSDLVRATLRGWWWLALRRRLKRFATVMGVVVCFLALLAGTMHWLFEQGYLTAWMIGMGSRQMAKEFPEMTKPAQPWPQSQDEKTKAPSDAAGLYSMTNIWRAKISLTPEQWKEVQPSRIRPVPHLFQSDGRIILRNPLARRSGLAGAVGFEYNWTQGDLQFADREFSTVAVRFRGNGTYLESLSGPKQSYKVDLNKYTAHQGLAGIHTLNFVNSIPDNSYVKDALAEKLFRELGAVAPRTAYAYLSVDVPGKFTNQALGLYILIENIDADFAVDRFGSKKVPIFKPVTYDLFKDLGSDWKAYANVYDLKTKSKPGQEERVIEFARLVSHGSDEEFARRLADFLDFEEFAGFLGGHVLLASYDGFLTNGQNYYVYLDPETERFGFIPWDQDHSWGEFGHIGTTQARENASIWKPSVYDNRFLDRVLKVEAFRAVYRRKLERALEESFTIERLYPEIDQLAALLRPAVAAESEFRLKRFDQSVSTNWLSGPRDGPEPEGPKAPVHQIKRFIVNRIKSVREQLDGKSEGIVVGRPRPR
jgi:DNA-directed RNA polymerase specialized sigma24 family protein